MRLLLFTIPFAVLLGLASGGRPSNLADRSFRWPLAGLAGIGLQFVPASGAAGWAILVLSFVLLLVAAGVNWRLPGFVLLLAGLWLNSVVIAVNQGMPVSKQAIVASGQADTLDELRDGADSKHHLATAGDELRFLGDVIPIGPPVRQAVSVGDLAVHAGAIWFVVVAMRGRRAAPRGSEAADLIAVEATR